MEPADDEDINWDNVKIVWHSPVPDIHNIEQLIREDCTQSLRGLGKVSDLIFHHVFLGKDMDTDVVCVWGEDGTEDLQCEFRSSVTWHSLKELDDD